MTLVYHEQQEARWCAKHCLNNCFQGPIFDKSICKRIAEEIAAKENKLYEGEENPERPSNSYENHHYSQNGDLSIEVLTEICSRYGGELEYFNSERSRKEWANKKFYSMIFNREDHWWAVRKIGGMFVNLDSMLGVPSIILDIELYMEKIKTVRSAYAFLMLGDFRGIKQYDLGSLGSDLVIQLFSDGKTIPSERERGGGRRKRETSAVRQTDRRDESVSRYRYGASNDKQSESPSNSGQAGSRYGRPTIPTQNSFNTDDNVNNYTNQKVSLNEAILSRERDAELEREREREKERERAARRAERERIAAERIAVEKEKDRLADLERQERERKEREERRLLQEREERERREREERERKEREERERRDREERERREQEAREKEEKERRERKEEKRQKSISRSRREGTSGRDRSEIRSKVIPGATAPAVSSTARPDAMRSGREKSVSKTKPEATGKESVNKTQTMTERLIELGFDKPEVKFIAYFTSDLEKAAEFLSHDPMVPVETAHDHALVFNQVRNIVMSITKAKQKDEVELGLFNLYRISQLSLSCAREVLLSSAHNVLELKKGLMSSKGQALLREYFAKLEKDVKDYGQLKDLGLKDLEIRIALTLCPLGRDYSQYVDVLLDKQGTENLGSQLFTILKEAQSLTEAKETLARLAQFIRRRQEYAQEMRFIESFKGFKGWDDAGKEAGTLLLEFIDATQLGKISTDAPSPINDREKEQRTQSIRRTNSQGVLQNESRDYSTIPYRDSTGYPTIDSKNRTLLNKDGVAVPRAAPSLGNLASTYDRDKYRQSVSSENSISDSRRGVGTAPNLRRKEDVKTISSIGRTPIKTNVSKVGTSRLPVGGDYRSHTPDGSRDRENRDRFGDIRSGNHALGREGWDASREPSGRRDIEKENRDYGVTLPLDRDRQSLRAQDTLGERNRNEQARSQYDADRTSKDIYGRPRQNGTDIYGRMFDPTRGNNYGTTPERNTSLLDKARREQDALLRRTTGENTRMRSEGGLRRTAADLPFSGAGQPELTRDSSNGLIDNPAYGGDEMFYNRLWESRNGQGRTQKPSGRYNF